MGRGDSRVVGAVAVLVCGFVAASAAAGEPNLVGHWKLDGNAGDSAGVNHGALLGNPTWANDPQRGWCLDFDGEGDYVDVGDDPSLTFSDAITVACWIKVRQFDRNWNAIITKGDDWVMARTRDDNRVAFLCLGPDGRRLAGSLQRRRERWDLAPRRRRVRRRGAEPLSGRRSRRRQVAARRHQPQLDPRPHRRERTIAQPLLERPDRRRAASTTDRWRPRRSASWRRRRPCLPRCRRLLRRE